MNHESILKLALGATVTTIQLLVIALTLSLGWSALAVITVVFLLSYPLIWLAWRGYHFWYESLTQLTSYTQHMQEGDGNVQLKKTAKNNLLGQLQHQISELGELAIKQSKQKMTVDNVIATIMDSWPIPVALFDGQLKLIYRNNAIAGQLKQPMLGDHLAKDMGFSFDNNQLNHQQLNDNWQCQTMQYSDTGGKRLLFWALDIHKPLYQQQSHAQNNLVRVLGHEIRNSLTPISSMADTLLSNDSLPEAQTRQVLERIALRADRLLNFIEHYAKLNQLPPPSPQWFELNKVIEEAKAMVPQLHKVTLTGEQRTFADPLQMTQVFINLLKNAAEAGGQQAIEVDISHYHNGREQVLTICDNGPGFANPDNVLTPFYTTKSQGSGIGLALCVEIIARHNGKLGIGNTPKGAEVELLLPIPTNSAANFSDKG